jgi:hypothetical protein
LVEEITLGESVVEVPEGDMDSLPVGLVVNEALLTLLLACVLMAGGILRKTRAGGNWLIGGMVEVFISGTCYGRLKKGWSSCVAVPYTLWVLAVGVGYREVGE